MTHLKRIQKPLLAMTASAALAAIGTAALILHAPLSAQTAVVPVVPPAASVLRSRLDAVFLEHGQPPPQNIVETASLPVIIHLLRHSDLLTALPAESVGPYLQTGQMCVLPIELGVRMEFFGIIRRRDQLLSPGAERVLDAIRSTARRLYTDLEPSPTGTAPPSGDGGGGGG